jgi:hypothetical protein
MIKDLEARIKENTRIQLTDLFGKGRIRKQMYEYDCMRTRKNEEIATLKDISIRQAEAVTSMVIRSAELEKENAMLRRCVKEGDEARKSLANKLAMAESEISALKNKYGTEEAS